MNMIYIYVYLIRAKKLYMQDEKNQLLITHISFDNNIYSRKSKGNFVMAPFGLPI